MNGIDVKARNRNRLLLMAIVAVFLVPIILAGVLRFTDQHPPVTKQRGELLEPKGDLRSLTPKLLDGGTYAWNPVSRTWRIVVAPPVDCGAECVKAAHDIHVVWELLGREASRVDVLWLCASEPCAPPADAPKQANLRLLRTDSNLRAKLPQVDAVSIGTAPGREARGVPVYVVDPNGFVILRYAPGSDPGDLRADLAKLLKLK